jgi:hypothetical protein
MGRKPGRSDRRPTGVAAFLRPVAGVETGRWFNVNTAVFISVVSVAIAFASLIINFFLNRTASIRARKPVLVFIDDPEQGSWILRNVGNGPALNILVAERASGWWFNPVRVTPLARDASFALTWLGRVNISGLGASYADFENRRYTSTLGAEISRAYDGDRLPNWDEKEIKRYWELPADRALAGWEEKWGEKSSDFSM